MYAGSLSLLVEAFLGSIPLDTLLPIPPVPPHNSVRAPPTSPSFSPPCSANSLRSSSFASSNSPLLSITTPSSTSHDDTSSSIAPSCRRHFAPSLNRCCGKSTRLQRRRILPSSRSRAEARRGGAVSEFWLLAATSSTQPRSTCVTSLDSYLRSSMPALLRSGRWTCSV